NIPLQAERHSARRQKTVRLPTGIGVHLQTGMLFGITTESCSASQRNRVHLRPDSQAKQDRPALTALLGDLRKRKVDVILVWALDRLARSLKQLLNIAEECRSLGGDLVSLKQNVDTTLPAGRLTFQVLGAVAEFEREMLRTRVKAGLEMARRNGKRLGRPALRRFGSDEVSEIRRLRKSGTSVRSLAVRYGTTQYLISKLSEARS